MSHLVSPMQIYERLAKVLFLAVIAIFLWFLYLSLQSSRFCVVITLFLRHSRVFHPNPGSG